MAGICFATPEVIRVALVGGQQEPEQLNLFGEGVDMAKLRKRAAALMTGARSLNTQRAYAHDWADFSVWCEMAGRQAMPAKAETVRLYLSASIGDGKKLSTVERRLAAVVAIHKRENKPIPVDEETRAMVSGARRSMPASVGKAAVTVKQLRQMCGKLGRSPIGTRNHALLLLGFATGMRRSELSALDVEDLQFVAKGLRVRIVRSKTDQEGKGREVGVFQGKHTTTDPLKWVKYWLKVRGNEPGPLFVQFGAGGVNKMERLGEKSIGEIVQDAAESIGLDRTRYGAHSLRAGLVTAAAENGVPEYIIMQTTGHRSVQTLVRYVRPSSAFSFNPLRAAL